MMKINTIWDDLEKDSSSSFGLLLRRYSPLILQEVFVALQLPEKIRCIAISLKKNHNLNISRYSNLKDIRIELIQNEKDRSKQYLLISLTNREHGDVFGALCEDLMTGIVNITDEKKFIQELLNRFQKWKLLFEKAWVEGLSPEEQRGLYGELYFLRKWLHYSSDKQRPVQAWLGPENNIRDFQLSDWGIEVKTTHGNNHQKIHINNERQLDASTLKSLFLFHISLEIQQHNGETVNQLIDSINILLSSDLAAQTQYRSKLLMTGYFMHHRSLYEITGYQIRQETWYVVKDDFPRIEEKDLRRGIGDVQYSIILSDYKIYILNEAIVFETIN
jgi:hypothetical protein